MSDKKKLRLEMIKKESTFKKRSRLHPRIHAKNLDRLLGYRIPKIEVKLLQKYRAYDRPNDESNKKQHYKGTQTWIGLHPEALQTPYNDLYDALQKLQSANIKHVVDIGAGYGRVGLVMSSIFPNSQFTGFEVLKQRAGEGNRLFKELNLDNCEILTKNVLDQDFILPHADIYFIYDFSELPDLCTILDTLSQRLGKESFFLITKGNRIDFLLGQRYKEFWKDNGWLDIGELKIYSSFLNNQK